MKILVFAHKLEAQHFTSHIRWLERSPNLYKSKECYLLITAQGGQNAQFKLKKLLETTPEKIDMIINFGIAGALDQKIKVGSIHSIDKIHDEIKKDSYALNDAKATIDCITSRKPVLDQLYAKELLQKAPLVDMELWSIAHVARPRKIPLYSFKIISDMADSETDLINIRKQAIEYSEKLFKHYTDLKI